MHIPDGLLSAPVSFACGAFSTVAVGAAVARRPAMLGARAVAMLGVTASFVFASQMLNFPVAGGTSGHLIGGVLAAVLVGPSAAIVIMTAVLVLQCLVFGDGGLLALGANVLNMAVIHPLVGFALYRAIVGKTSSAPRRLAGVAFASWAATLVAAATCAGELALSRIATSAIVLPAMLGSHFFIGVGEALISALVVVTLLRLRPELVGGRPARVRPLVLGVLGLTVSLALALFVSPFACSWPDGLERVVERLGVEPAHVTVRAPLNDYAMPGLSGPFKTSAAAVLGTLLVFALCCGLGVLLAPRAKPSS